MSVKLLTISSNKSKDSQTHNFTMHYNTPLFCNEEWEMALTSCQLWYSMTNIAAEYSNNTFKISYDGGTTYKTLTLADGLYTISTLSSAISALIVADGGTGTNVYLSMNTTTFRSMFVLKNGYYCLDLTEGAFAQLIGFNAEKLDGDSIYFGETMPDLSRNITSICICTCCDQVSESYNNNMASNILYSLVPNVSAGAMIDKTVTNLVFLPVSTKTLSQLKISITDQMGRLISLQQEPVTVSLIIIRKRTL